MNETANQCNHPYTFTNQTHTHTHTCICLVHSLGLLRSSGWKHQECRVRNQLVSIETDGTSALCVHSPKHCIMGQTRPNDIACECLDVCLTQLLKAFRIGRTYEWDLPHWKQLSSKSHTHAGEKMWSMGHGEKKKNKELCGFKMFQSLTCKIHWCKTLAS